MPDAIVKDRRTSLAMSKGDETNFISEDSSEKGHLTMLIMITIIVETFHDALIRRIVILMFVT